MNEEMICLWVWTRRGREGKRARLILGGETSGVVWEVALVAWRQARSSLLNDDIEPWLENDRNLDSRYETFNARGPFKIRIVPVFTFPATSHVRLPMMSSGQISMGDQLIFVSGRGFRFEESRSIDILTSTSSFSLCSQTCLERILIVKSDRR